MTTIIHAFDPGKATGAASFTVDDGVHLDWSAELDEDDMYSYAYRLTSGQNDPAPTPHVIVCESYVQRPGAKSQSPWSLELIGLLRYCAWHTGSDFVLQRPGDAKGVMPNSRLKEFGLWHVGSDHARDAIRHGAYHILTRPGGGGYALLRNTTVTK